MTFDRSPGTTSGNAHALVIVADRTPRGERIAQPEPAIKRDRIGKVRERGSAFVGGHHQIRIVAVMAHHIARMHQLAIDQVVGRSEEHTSELQSLMRTSYAVLCLKKKIQML